MYMSFTVLVHPMTCHAHSNASFIPLSFIRNWGIEHHHALKLLRSIEDVNKYEMG